MKIHEIVNEDYDGSKKPITNDDTPWQGIHPEHKSVQREVVKTRDDGGYDRTYHLNRMMMAMAMHDGKGKHTVDMPASSWIEKYNSAHPYTKEESDMVHGAMKTIPTDGKTVQKWSKSKEPDDTHKQSPVQARKKNKYGV
jgi:hypothetical protein